MAIRLGCVREEEEVSELAFACGVLSARELSASHPSFPACGKDSEGHFPSSALCPGQHRTEILLFIKEHAPLSTQKLPFSSHQSAGIISPGSQLSAYRSPLLTDYVADFITAVGAVPFKNSCSSVHFPFCRRFLFPARLFHTTLAWSGRKARMHSYHARK